LKTIRIYTLARELKVSNAEVLEMARSQGANVSTASSAISEAIAAAIRDHHSKRESPRPAAPRSHGSRKAAPAAVDNRSAEVSEPAAPPSRQSHSRQKAPQTESASHRKHAAQPAVAPEGGPTQQPDQAKSKKRLYLIDGLNVCNWPTTTSLAPLLTLMIELKRQGHQFLCIFDANTRFVLEDLGERDKYEHLLNKYDIFGEVPGGTQADDFLLYRAHKTGDAIVTNDQYRDQKYRERYKWLRSVSPRLCKGMVLGGFLILPELDVHARIRESLPGIMKDFEEAFGAGSSRERLPDHRQAHSTHRRKPPGQAKVSTSAPHPAEAKEIPPVPPPAAPTEPAVKLEGQAGSQGPSGEPRPRSRRRRRRGRRGGGGAQGSNGGAPQGENSPAAG
jgi:hypothetical protein